MTTNDIRQALSKALSRVSPDNARLVEDPKTDVTVYPAPFFRAYHIYEVTHFGAYKPIMFYAGFAPGEQAYLLTGHPENYVRMGKADQIHIDSSKMASDYAAAYLDVTRSMSTLFYLINSTDEMRFFPGLTPEETEAKDEFVAKYGDQITGPSAESTSQGYVVTIFAVREQAVERHTLSLSQQGDISAKVTTLEKDLPLVYGA